MELNIQTITGKIQLKIKDKSQVSGHTYYHMA